MLPFLAGALCAALLYVAAILICAGLRAYHVDRRWTLAYERHPATSATPLRAQTSP